MSSDTGRSEGRLAREYSWVALVLAAVAGAVDGIGYLLLLHIFTSHVSGNTVAMMMHVAAGDWAEAWRHFEPVMIFFFGMCVGVALTDLLRTKISRSFSIVAGLECLLLIAFVILARPPMQWMVVFPAGAMGIQNAMLRRVGHHSVRTTYVTGMLTNAAQGLVETVREALARSGEAGKKIRDLLFYGGIWLCFATGGVTGTLLDMRFGPVALFAPIAALCALIVYDLIDPLTGVHSSPS